MDTSEETGDPILAANSTAAASAPQTRCSPERPRRGASRDGLTWPLGGLTAPEAANQRRPRLEGPAPSLTATARSTRMRAPVEDPCKTAAATEVPDAGVSGWGSCADASPTLGADPLTSTAVRAPCPVLSHFHCSRALRPVHSFGTGELQRRGEGRKVTVICARPGLERRSLPSSA